MLLRFLVARPIIIGGPFWRSKIADIHHQRDIAPGGFPAGRVNGDDDRFAAGAGNEDGIFFEANVFQIHIKHTAGDGQCELRIQPMIVFDEQRDGTRDLLIQKLPIDKSDRGRGAGELGKGGSGNTRHLHDGEG